MDWSVLIPKLKKKKKQKKHEGRRQKANTERLNIP